MSEDDEKLCEALLAGPPNDICGLAGTPGATAVRHAWPAGNLSVFGPRAADRIRALSAENEELRKHDGLYLATALAMAQAKIEKLEALAGQLAEALDRSRGALAAVIVDQGKLSSLGWDCVNHAENEATQALAAWTAHTIDG